ncbi:DUF294 nucleotidyltransferase-like domain-containing protein [Heyndrickxia camelliae]|uniref:CBS domain-containing protein n=1 Tax=Heyndrickxia camelliae TaxID=1707093 RepID=A0A2N3LMF2_9BACI|nr:DUF294 nucleotidyltransferase-like domain-containing protein [Heyndrickxia camelliae]PKR85798.1 hypothetical protein CWO92_05310 [Heyndrickxia camelliae]
MEFCSYKDLKTWKDNNIVNFISDIAALNDFHDKVMRKVIEIASRRMKAAIGELPCRFTWFVMGSAGRSEQSVTSDQDHGIIYENHDERCGNYFKCLGKEITDGMEQVGYSYCDGNVMSSNPKWCKSLSEWKNQLILWMEEENMESLRYLHIFLDARAVVGENSFLSDLSQVILTHTYDKPLLIHRLLANIQHIPKGLNPLGQFIIERTSPTSKMIDIKKTIYIPYVNIIRLLSLIYRVTSISTLERMDSLMEITEWKNPLTRSHQYFEQLLAIRIELSVESIYGHANSLYIKKLNQDQKRLIKRMMKDVINLHESVERLLRKRRLL